jgi:hypothetical protein
LELRVLQHRGCHGIDQSAHTFAQRSGGAC